MGKIPTKKIGGKTYVVINIFRDKRELKNFVKSARKTAKIFGYMLRTSIEKSEDRWGVKYTLWGRQDRRKK